MVRFSKPNDVVISAPVRRRPSRSHCSFSSIFLLMMIAGAGFALTAMDMSFISIKAMTSVMTGETSPPTVKTGSGSKVHENAFTSGNKKNSGKEKILQISVLGERNSGTRWTFGHLGMCFNHSIKVTTTFTRYKHWFQEPAYNRYKHNTLVIAQFRNPYDWLKAMQNVPHHSPAHMAYRDQSKWKKFLTKEWTMERIGTDRWPNQTEPCQQYFEWKDLVSCQRVPIPKEEYKKLEYSNHQPFYEMRNDGSGKPYKNIMKMRTDKIRNFLTVKDYEGVIDAWTVQYEYLLTKGTKAMIDRVAALTGIEPKCKPYPAQNRKSRAIPADMADYISKNLNWTVEGWVGYVPQKG